MPRIRSIKPEIASDAKLSRVSIEAAYTFVLMITQADDLGLLPGAHRQILGILYPLRENVTVPLLLVWIEELVSVNLVRWRATRDGVPVLELVNWAKHQRIDNAGRSQLGALLAESPAEPSDRPAATPPEFAESRGDSPRVAESRGLDLRPPTKEQGPRTEEVSAAARALSIRANQGLAEHPDCPQLIPRIIATSAKTRSAAEAILKAGVPLAFAESHVYELARTHHADGEVRSLVYFQAAVIRAWTEHQAAEAAATADAPLAVVGNGRRRVSPGAQQVANILGRPA